MKHPGGRWLAALLCVVLFSGAAPACSVPVFRYALERWPADPYEVIVFHRGPLHGADKAALAKLEDAVDGKPTPANLTVTAVDLDGTPAPELAKLWEAQGEVELPWMVVRYPRTLRRDDTVWATKLTAASAGTLLDSPFRTKLVKQLLKGETAVWVLLESGAKEKDDAAAELLEKQLKRMPEVLQLPELSKDDPADRIATGPGAPELKISFVLLRLSRRDPAEQALISMLLHSEEDLLKFDGEPIAMPVFGRGRADFALVGKGIEAQNIQDGCARLVGPCTCTVKRLYPGTDLLIAADWDGAWKGSPKVAARPATTPTPAPTKKAEPPPVEDEAEAPADGSMQKLLLVLLACVAVTMTAVFAFGKWRR